MTGRQEQGFTLIELMLVVVLIAIMAAITVPQVIQVARRGHLEETINTVHRAISETRSLAMKTRLATVLELRENMLWINQLEGEACHSDFRHRCVQSLGWSSDLTTADNVIRWDEGVYAEAGVTMCDFRVAMVGVPPTPTCGISSVNLSSGAGLCYNGSGQLWIRTGVDPNTACVTTAGGQPGAGMVWQKACVPWAANPGGSAPEERFSGADIRFNRFDVAGGLCPAGGAAANARDVTRQILAPAGGHPLVRLP